VTTYFCDGLKDVTIVNGVSRLEFDRLEVVERGGNRELRPVSEFTVALPVQDFVNVLGTLENVRERLAVQGLITPAGFEKGGRAAASAREIAEFFLTKSDSLRLEMRPPNIERPQAVARPESD
jgi:hypothetical protein